MGCFQVLPPDANNVRARVKPCIGKEAQARVSAVIGRRKKERENTTCCVCERDRHSRLHRKKWLPLLYRLCIAAIYSISFAPVYLYRALTFSTFLFFLLTSSLPFDFEPNRVDGPVQKGLIGLSSLFSLSDFWSLPDQTFSHLLSNLIQPSWA